jgi:hypothetical protein
MAVGAQDAARLVLLVDAAGELVDNALIVVSKDPEVHGGRSVGVDTG